jgi:uncharacterized membrane protein
MEQQQTEQQHLDRYKNRRRMAWLSFVFTSMLGAYLVDRGMQSDEAAARVNSLMGVIMAIVGVWGGIIGAYFGVTFGTDKLEIKGGQK